MNTGSEARFPERRQYGQGASRLNPNRVLTIKGAVRGVRAEEAEDPLTREARYPDKPVDEPEAEALPEGRAPFLCAFPQARVCRRGPPAVRRFIPAALRPCSRTL